MSNSYEIWKVHNNFLKVYRKFAASEKKVSGKLKASDVEKRGELEWKKFNKDLIGASNQIREWEEILVNKKKKSSLFAFFKQSCTQNNNSGFLKNKYNENVYEMKTRKFFSIRCQYISYKPILKIYANGEIPPS